MGKISILWYFSLVSISVSIPIVANFSYNSSEVFNVNTFLKIGIHFENSSDIWPRHRQSDIRPRQHNAQNYWSSMEPSLRLYLLPFQNLIFHCSWKRIHVNRPCPDADSRFFFKNWRKNSTKFRSKCLKIRTEDLHISP